MSCEHVVTCVRFKVDTLGRNLFADQCEACGERVGDWISHRSPLTQDAEAWKETTSVFAQRTERA